jgi:hypothetical protein
MTTQSSRDVIQCCHPISSSVVVIRGIVIGGCHQGLSSVVFILHCHPLSSSEVFIWGLSLGKASAVVIWVVIWVVILIIIWVVIWVSSGCHLELSFRVVICSCHLGCCHLVLSSRSCHLGYCHLEFSS